MLEQPLCRSLDAAGKPSFTMPAVYACVVYRKDVLLSAVVR